jgi:hypothetical protein
MDNALPPEVWEIVISFGVHPELLLVNLFFNRLVAGRLTKDNVLRLHESLWWEFGIPQIPPKDGTRWTLYRCRITGEAVLYEGTALVWRRWYNGR